MTTGPASPADSPHKRGSRGRRVRPRDWIAVAVVAVLALGTGIYLIARPAELPSSASGAPADSPGTGEPSPASSAGSSAAAPSASEPSAPDPSSSGRPPPESSSPGTADHSDPAADSAVPPAGPTPGQQATKIGPLGDLASRKADDPLALGDVDAPVVMVMFSDYRCPFCAKFSRTLEPRLVEKYVQAGILRVEWRDLPIFGDQSQQAAVAGRAAAAQGRFWEFNRAVYAAAPGTGHPDLTTDKLVAFAEQAGVPDVEAFRAALDDPELAAAVAEDLDLGSALGVPSTPAFVINGYPLVGAQPLEEFVTLIDTVRKLR